MGQWAQFRSITTNATGQGSQTSTDAIGDPTGALMHIYVSPDQSTSLDVTVNQVLPDGTKSEIYSATGITTVARADRNNDFNAVQLVGTVEVVVENAGEHASAAHVFFVVIDTN